MKSCIITGGNSGIGFQAALQIAEKGYPNYFDLLQILGMVSAVTLLLVFGCTKLPILQGFRGRLAGKILF